MIAIGEIRKTYLPFFDVSTNKMAMKTRPALIIAKADNTDYVVLPISRITRQEYRNQVYDLEIDPTKYPCLNLNSVSFVRTHKQTIVHGSEIGDLIGTIAGNYDDLYLSILELQEQFSKEITTQALI